MQKELIIDNELLEWRPSLAIPLTSCNSILISYLGAVMIREIREIRG